MVCGDRQRLGQVLNNLLSNALRHTPAGGQVQVALSARNSSVRLAVIDSGEGIAPAELPQLFDRFYRGDRSRARQTGGSGLGLAIARQLVQAQQGRIWAASPPPSQTQGSVFYVELPKLYA
jgi:signal transduction histidine kinase